MVAARFGGYKNRLTDRAGKLSDALARYSFLQYARQRLLK